MTPPPGHPWAADLYLLGSVPVLQVHPQPLAGQSCDLHKVLNSDLQLPDW